MRVKKQANKLLSILLLTVFFVSICISMFILFEKNNKVVANSTDLLYKLDFSDVNDIGKNTSGTEFAGAVLKEENSLSVENSKIGNALIFPGESKYVNYLELPTSIFENQDVITFAGWFYLPQGIDAYLGEIGIYSQDNEKTFRTDPYANYHGDAYIICAGSKSNINLNTGVKPVYDTWYHMSYVIDAQNKTFTVFQNAAEVLSFDLEDGFSPSDFYSPDSHFYLGQSAYEDNHNDYKGKMSDFRIYGAALTAQQIKSEYGLSILDFMTAEYTFDFEDNFFKDNVRGYDLAYYNSSPNFSGGKMSLSGGSAVQPFNKSNNHKR